ncbi:MAG: c-type cytochrome biogenesis protein CcmI [Cellvibrionales bacterium]|nr:c-type cytochrome biogenesis protein CcmI [Cellvibrionales bacterium]
MFSLFSLGFVLLTGVFFAWIFLFRQVNPNRLHNDKRIKRNISIYKEQIAALEGDLEHHRISPKDYALLTTEAARTLLNAKNQSTPKPNGQPKWLTAGLALLVLTPFLAFPLYGELGAWDDIHIKHSLAALEQSPSQAAFNQQATQLLNDIEERLDDKSNNPDYRLIAARLAYTLKAYDKAAIHFSVIAELVPENAEALAMLGQSRYLANQQQFSLPVRQPLETALTLNPHQATALNLLAMDAYERQEYEKTIEYWQRLLTQITPDSPQTQMLLQGIAKAKEKLGTKPLQTRDILSGKTPKETQGGIQVSVTLAEELSTLDPNLPVFIFAKAANGPPMPLAVQKLKVRDLPITVTLNDETAMMPSMKLSQFPEVIIGARVSLSGQPQAAKGDWQSVLVAIDQAIANTTNLLIDTEVK